MTGVSPGPLEMSPGTFSQVSALGKNSGKYLPYANVDTFLKTCRKVGLTDVELFTPPDAVESKDIRRVCTSIRSLAKKARAQHIRVPDFEDVNRPLPMKNDKTVGIKESLQHSHSSPITSKVARPEADIIKSERFQIISRFLSSTNPLYSPDEDNSSRYSSEPPSPVTPGPLKSPSMKDSSLSTPTATIGGIDTPLLTKSVSVIELPTQSPSPGSSVDQPYDSSSPFSKRALGSFRHTQPHFFKKSSSQTNLPDQADDIPFKSPAPHPKPETTPSSPAVSVTSIPASSTPSTPAILEPSRQAAAKKSTPAISDPSTPAVAKTSTPAASKPSTPAISDPSTPTVAKTSTLPALKPSTPTAASDNPTEKTKELPNFAQLGLGGAYRHAQPHFSLKKSSQDSQFKLLDEQPEPNAVHGKPKAPSSNKIFEKEPRTTTQQTQVPGKASFGPAPKVNQGSSVPAKEPANKPEAKVPGMQLNPRFWMPLVAGALAFVGTLLVVRSRDTSPVIIDRVPIVYEVQEGDTLSTISKRVGKKNWDELVKLNPNILNPDLIYPSERLKLSS